jgi:sterol desaturase/sphingolipid hydroxylase (fatty acid hydroxylase superfamily)
MWNGVFQRRSRLPGKEANAMETIIPILIPASFIVALVVERLFPARPLPRVRGWLWKGLAFFAFTFLVNGAVPALVAVVVGDRAPLDLSGMGVVMGAIAGFLVADFLGYWIHRLMHRVPRLWRWTHQMHHSAERMDLAGMTYSHPLDTLLVFSLTGLATALLGLSPAAAAIAGLMGYGSAVIQHANIRTPRLLGYLIQRPEQHGLHHQRGVHAYNYGSFMLWDLMFGTFRNPAGFPEAYGFWDGASKRVGAMLIGRDVGRP